MVCLLYELICNISTYTLETDQWIAKFELECLILMFIYFNSNFKVTCKDGVFECSYIRTHLEKRKVKKKKKKKTSKIFNITLAIFSLSHQNTSTKLPS